MASKYYIPAGKGSPNLGLNIVWAWLVTAKLWQMPGWAHGVFWTLYVFILIANGYAIWKKEPYDEKKMDRILGGD